MSTPSQRWRLISIVSLVLLAMALAQPVVFGRQAGPAGVAKIASGRTRPGITAWKAHGTTAIYVDIDTSAAHFGLGPEYVASLYGTSYHSTSIGVSSIYNPTSTGFRVYVRLANGGPISPEQANAWDWRVVWIGME
jgi:hypothetical protein